MCNVYCHFYKYFACFFHFIQTQIKTSHNQIFFQVLSTLIYTSGLTRVLRDLVRSSSQLVVGLDSRLSPQSNHIALFLEIFMVSQRLWLQIYHTITYSLTLYVAANGSMHLTMSPPIQHDDLNTFKNPFTLSPINTYTFFPILTHTQSNIHQTNTNLVIY